MSKPQLYVFAISHYCEKSRWALDHLGIDHEVRFLAPGPHMSQAKKLGLSSSSLPILRLDAESIQGSSAIIDWAEANKSADSVSLSPTRDLDLARDFEQRLDDVLGIHVRRYYYSEALVEYPNTVLPVFSSDLSRLRRVLTAASWGIVRRLMIKGMDLGKVQGQESRQLLLQELDWLDSLLEDGRDFYFGERLSRADISAASLLSPLARPPQHRTYSSMEFPPQVAEDCATWQDRPCLALTRRLYQQR